MYGCNNIFFAFNLTFSIFKVILGRKNMGYFMCCEVKELNRSVRKSCFSFSDINCYLYLIIFHNLCIVLFCMSGSFISLPRVPQINNPDC